MNFAILFFLGCSIILFGFMKVLYSNYKESRKETKRLYDIYLKSFYASDREKYKTEKFNRNFYLCMIFFVSIFFTIYFLATVYLITK